MNINNDIKNIIENINTLLPAFNKAKDEHPFSDLGRLPISVTPCEEGCLIRASRNGAITYSSCERTYYSVPVVAAVLCAESFASCYPTGRTKDIKDELLKFIIDSTGIDSMGIHVKKFIFNNMSHPNEKTSSDHPYSCEELNTMHNTNYKSILEFVKCTNIFHGFTLLIDSERPYLQYITSGEALSEDLHAFYYSGNNIIEAMELFIETVNELEND